MQREVQREVLWLEWVRTWLVGRKAMRWLASLVESRKLGSKSLGWSMSFEAVGPV